MTLLRNIIFLSLFLTPITVHSYQFDYVGLSLHEHKYTHLSFAPQIELAELARLEYNDSLAEMGTRFFIGRQFNNYVGLEVGFTSFGRANFTAIENESVIEGEFKTSAADIRVVGTYPINRSLFLKAQLGFTSWDNDVAFLVEDDASSYSTEKTSNQGSDLLAGVGIGYGFNRLVAISFDIEKTEINKIKTDNLGLSLLLRF
jgi:hypothetical protein